MRTINWKKEILTIPNLLSLFRLLLIPLYITLYQRATASVDYIIAAAVLAISCLTDMIDGKIARKFNQITMLGKFLDPLADKATQFSLIVCLALKYPVLLYLIILFVVKESFMLIAAGVRYKKGSVLKGALFSGKICTTILFVSLILMVLLPDLNNVTVNIITLIDTVFMFLAFADYVLAYLRFDNKFQPVEQSPSDM